MREAPRTSPVEPVYKLRPRLERKHRPELIAPVVGLPGGTACEGQEFLRNCSSGPVIVGCESYDIARLMHESDPLVEPVSERSGVEIGAAQKVAMGSIGVIGPIGA